MITPISHQCYGALLERPEGECIDCGITSLDSYGRSDNPAVLANFTCTAQ